MIPYCTCHECVSLFDSDGGGKDSWRCSRLKREHKYLSSRIGKQFKTFRVLEDGRVQPSSCPLDREVVR